MLHLIQALHNPILDSIMVTVFNQLVGSLGQFWILVGLLLLDHPKDKKMWCGSSPILCCLFPHWK